jgi:hypothetical protein
VFWEGGVAAVADVAKKVSSDRLVRILPEAIQAIHEVIRKNRVTEEEWLAVLDFFTEVGKQDEFVLLSDVTKTSVLVDSMTHEDESGVTPSDVEGPLYREDPPWREKPVKIYEEYEGVEDGDVLLVRGKVTSTDGAPRRTAATSFRRWCLSRTRSRRTGRWVGCLRPQASTRGVRRTYISSWRRKDTSRSSRKSSSRTTHTWRTTP